MSVNLIEMAKSLFANEVASKAATAFGESESGVNKAISALVPTIFSGLAHKATTPDGAEQISRLAQENAQGGLFDNLGSLLSTGDNSSWFSRGSSLVSSLFGNKVDNIVNTVTNYAGIKSSSSSSLLSLAVPAVLGFLGKYIRTNNLNPSGLASLLSSQSSNVTSALPAGFSLANLFGHHHDNTYKTTTATSTAPASTARTTYVEDDKQGGGIGKWLLPLLLLALLAAGALYYFNGGCNKKDTVVTDSTTTVTTDTTKGNVVTNAVDTAVKKIKSVFDADSNYVYDLGKDVTITLPNNGGTLTVGENSTENKLYNYLNGSDAIDKNKWFELTNTYFKTGSATVTEQSMAQLKNLVQIAKAFPKAQFKIGGYTDNTGSEAANMKLSASRAAAVVAEIKKLGAAASSIAGSEGYGSQHPIGDNATAEGRAQNRRVAVNVRAK